MERPDPGVADHSLRIGEPAAGAVAAADQVVANAGAIGAERDDPVAGDPADLVAANPDAARGLRPPLARARPIAAGDADHEDPAPAHVLDPVLLNYETTEAADAGPGRVDLDPAAAARVLAEVAAHVVNVEIAEGEVACRLAGGDQMDAPPLPHAVARVDYLEPLDGRVRDVREPDAVLGARGDQRRATATVGADAGPAGHSIRRR